MLVLGFVALLAALFVGAVYLSNRASMSAGYSPAATSVQRVSEKPGPQSVDNSPADSAVGDEHASPTSVDDMQYLARLAESIVVSARSDEPAVQKPRVQAATPPQPVSSATPARPSGVVRDMPAASSPVMGRSDRAMQDAMNKPGESVPSASALPPPDMTVASASVPTRPQENARQGLSESVQGAASSTPQASAPEPAGLPIQVLNQVFSGFAYAYERGDLAALMGLFSAQARADVGGYAQIRQDYEQLFNSTELRRLDVGAIHWTIADNVYRGWAPYRASVVRKNAGKVSRFNGRLSIEVREFNRKPLITELLYTSSEGS